jgi:hypothetical protein
MPGGPGAERIAATEAPVDPHYRHTQMGWLILAVLAGIGVFLAVQLAGRGLPVPWLPLAILAVVLLLFGTLRVEVDGQSVRATFGIGLVRKTVPLADIAAFQPVRNPWFAGWGIRLIRGGTLWNVSGLDAVELALRDGRFFRIGTDDPEALARALEAAVGRPPSDTRAGVAAGLPSPPKRSPWLPYVVGGVILGGVVLVLLPVIVQMRPPVVTVRADGFDVKSPFYGQAYRADEITSIELVPRLPRIEARTNGFAGGGLLRGHFRLRDLGDGKLFLDTGQPPYVLVRLREGFVILGLDAAERTTALYDEMARSWPDKVAAR